MPPRETLQSGDVWTEAIANGAVNPVIDGLDGWGSIALVADANMNSDPTQLKGRTYGYLDRLKLFIVSPPSRVIGWNSAIAFSQAGLIAIPSATLSIPANSLGFVFITALGAIDFSTVLPNTCAPLAVVQTSATAIVLLDDVRLQAVEQIRPISLPAITSPFRPGDIKPTFSKVLEPGWIYPTSDLLAIADYPALFDTFGYDYGGSGSFFGVPNPEDCALAFAASNAEVGQILGANTTTINLGHLPRHNHGLVDAGHSHQTTDLGHNHVPLDFGHSHPVVDPKHFHDAERHRGAALNDDNTDGVGAELSTQGTGALMRVQAEATGISIGAAIANIQIQSAKSNIAVAPTTTGIAIAPVGEGQPFSTRTRQIKVRWLIKT